MESIEKITVRQENAVFTHSILWFSAHRAMEDGNKRNIPDDYMNSQILAAFSLEAYLNFIGEKLFPFWDDVERISKNNKLNMICSHLKIETDYSKKPFQSIKSLWKFRDQMAHARTTTVVEEWTQSKSKPMNKELPKTEWEKRCTKSCTDSAVNDVKEVIDLIHKKSNIRIGALGLISTGGGQILR